jgi:hypothetical protein
VKGVLSVNRQALIAKWFYERAVAEVHNSMALFLKVLIQLHELYIIKLIKQNEQQAYEDLKVRLARIQDIFIYIS